ncbi:MAG: alcohol dehydrogenase catalytic domain-containing protein [Desulfococcaceae bacterium]|jgi:threonine dehydrogenase-like Zn-dependent dehydrogenase|nr:alcohol dehydrogenase catalytic domain-containing protein [Desulfococcaceae bacterium]
MKALQLKNISELHRKDMPVPEPADGEILLRVTHCAVCRTDAKMWKQGQRDLRLPRILGHEICAVSPESGERFAVWPGTSCGHCVFCKKGAENLCREMKILGFHLDGGFAEYVCAPRKSLIPVPDDLPGELICLAEPLACTLNALEQCGLQKNQRVLIFGAGPLGLMTGMSVRYFGGFPCIREINPARVEQTAQFRKQMDTALHEGEEDADIVINAAPSSDIFTQGIPLLRPGGSFCLFSGFTDDKMIPAALLNQIHYRQLSVCGAYGCTKKQMETALHILRAYQKEASLLIEKQISLGEVQEILPQILKGQVMKCIIKN